MDVLAEPFIDGKLRGLGTSRHKLSLPLRYRSPVLELPASSGRVASQLPRVGRRGATEPAADLLNSGALTLATVRSRHISAQSTSSVPRAAACTTGSSSPPPAPPGPGSPCTGTVGAPATGPEPAPAPTAPGPPALTHRKITGCSTGYDPILRSDPSRSDLVHRGSPTEHSHPPPDPQMNTRLGFRVAVRPQRSRLELDRQSAPAIRRHSFQASK